MLEMKLSEDNKSYLAIENGQVINTCSFEIDGDTVKIILVGNEDAFLFDGLIRATCAFSRGQGVSKVVFSENVDKDLCVKFKFISDKNLNSNDIKAIFENKKCNG